MCHHVGHIHVGLPPVIKVSFAVISDGGGVLTFKSVLQDQIAIPQHHQLVQQQWHNLVVQSIGDARTHDEGVCNSIYNMNNE